MPVVLGVNISRSERPRVGGMRNKHLLLNVCDFVPPPFTHLAWNGYWQSWCIIRVAMVREKQ